MVDEQPSQSTFLEVVDNETREGVIRLNQKLKGLYAEIQAKLEMLDRLNNAEAIEQKSNLTILLAEVEKALLGIDNLTKMVVAPDITNAEFIQTNQDELEKFRKMVADNAEKITKLKEEF